MTKIDIPLDKKQWKTSPLPGQVVLVTTIDVRGKPNLAPKSWLSMVAFVPPPVLMFSCTLDHATARNSRDTGEFVVNVPPAQLADSCWAAGSTPSIRGRERFVRYGFTPTPSSRVAPPRIEECVAHLECTFDGIRSWGQEVAVFGEVGDARLDGVALEGPEPDRYRALDPFFFLHGGWTARLGPASRSQSGDAPVRHAMTILAVDDLDLSVGFYREAFGWPIRLEVPVLVEFELPCGKGLALYRRENFANNTGQRPERVSPEQITATELYFHCDRLEHTIEGLRASGARLLSPLARRAWGDEAACFVDPEGNVLAVARPRSPD